LAAARRKAEAARELVAEGFDPSKKRQAEKAAHVQARAVEARREQGLPPLDSFEATAREWFAVKRGGWAPSYADKIIARLEADVFPWIGQAPVAGITPPQLLEVLRRIESRGVVETAHRALENCSQVFRYAVATGKHSTNPARDLKDALKRPDPRNFPAITDPKCLGELLRAGDAYAATPVVRAALKLAPILLLRPGELRFGEWVEIDLDAALWTVPAVRMKRELREKLQGAPHLVPLPKQAVAVLRGLEPLTGGGRFIFRGERHHDRPMSENTINAALRDGLPGRRSDRTRLSRDGSNDAPRTSGLRPERHRGATRSLGPRQPGAGVQPNRVCRAAAGDVAEVGRLPGHAAAGCRGCEASEAQGVKACAAHECAEPAARLEALLEFLQ
jgi:integrase